MIMESFVTERQGVSAMGLGVFIDTLDCLNTFLEHMFGGRL